MSQSDFKSEKARRNEALDVLVKPLYAALWAAVAFSAVVNVLMLVSPLYMMQVFDRVISSRSTETLVYLTMIAFLALGVMSMVDYYRSRLLIRVGEWMERRAGHDAFMRALERLPMGGSGPSGDMALRDIARLRAFVASPAFTALLDLPWMPLYFILNFMIHPMLGWTAVASAVVMMVVTAIGDMSARRLMLRAEDIQARAMRVMVGAQRGSEAVQAMGLASPMAARWAVAVDASHAANRESADRIALVASVSKFIRFFFQVVTLCIGAWLVLQQEMTAGASIAASILMGRAVAPLDMAISSWRLIAQSFEAWTNIKAFMAVEPRIRRTELPPLRGALSVERVVFQLPGTERPILREVSFELPAGKALAIIGPSGSGKSTLARLLTGILPPTSGHVRIDAAEVHEIPRDQLGPQVGYLPQDVELFRGSVAENIARMEEPDDALVVAAARRARVHEMVLRLANGYETDIGDDGNRLSGGQRQRVGLARALYGEPRILVLDEPNANLDSEGEEALAEAIREALGRGATVVMITHRLNLVSISDYILFMRDGAVDSYGPRDEVLARMRNLRQASPSAAEAAAAAGPRVRMAATSGAGGAA
jgi:PrtD family type I secretion system ABC transporter